MMDYRKYLVKFPNQNDFLIIFTLTDNLLYLNRDIYQKLIISFYNQSTVQKTKTIMSKIYSNDSILYLRIFEKLISIPNDSKKIDLIKKNLCFLDKEIEFLRQSLSKLKTSKVDDHNNLERIVLMAKISIYISKKVQNQDGKKPKDSLKGNQKELGRLSTNKECFYSNIDEDLEPKNLKIDSENLNFIKLENFVEKIIDSFFCYYLYNFSKKQCSYSQLRFIIEIFLLFLKKNLNTEQNILIKYKAEQIFFNYFYEILKNCELFQSLKSNNSKSFFY